VIALVAVALVFTRVDRKNAQRLSRQL